MLRKMFLTKVVLVSGPELSDLYTLEIPERVHVSFPGQLDLGKVHLGGGLSCPFQLVLLYDPYCQRAQQGP